MGHYYFDSSALVKLYVTEAGSQWVRQVVIETNDENRPAHVISTANIALAEIAAAFARLGRMGHLSQRQQHELYKRMAEDRQQRFTWLATDMPTIERAASLTQRHPLRGYDAVHLAAALVLTGTLKAARLPQPIFVSADAVLLDAARAEGLAVHDPGQEA